MTNSPVSFDEADVIHWLEVEQQASTQVVAGQYPERLN